MGCTGPHHADPEEGFTDMGDPVLCTFAGRYRCAPTPLGCVNISVTLEDNSTIQQGSSSRGGALSFFHHLSRGGVSVRLSDTSAIVGSAADQDGGAQGC